MCLFIHMFTCIWIKLGSLDAHDDKWLTTPEADRTWMFRTGSDFTLDKRSIYEQLTGTEGNIAMKDDFIALYFYACYFVMTVLTTVGYGHATYGHPNELIYVMILEAIAAITQAYNIVLIQTTFNLSSYSYKKLLSQRMNDVDAWMVFKIQAQINPEKLSYMLTETMYESFK